MKTFLDIAVKNKLGIWNGYAQISNKDGNVRSYGYSTENSVWELIGHRSSENKKIVETIFVHDLGFRMDLKYATQIGEIRVSDCQLNECCGIIKRSTLLKNSQVNFIIPEIYDRSISLEEIKKSGTLSLCFNFRFYFGKKFNLPGIHSVYIEMTAQNKMSAFGHKIYGGYFFHISISRALVDACNKNPNVLSKLKKKFRID